MLLTPLLLVVGYAFQVKARIAEQAKKLAHGQPYCILVAKQKSHTTRGFTSVSTNYEVADSFMDTMGLIMRGDKARNHAVLVVGYQENQIHFHWSYGSFGFVEGAHAAYGNKCAPYKFDYANLRAADYLETTDIALDDATYRVPLVYQPRSYRDNPQTGVDEESFSINAVLPALRPAKLRCPAGVCHVITVSKAGTRDLQVYATATRPANDKHASSLHGLRKSAELRGSGDSDRPDPSLPWGNYYKVDTGAGITTRVRCLSSCTITFDREGLRYSFNIEPENLGQWPHYEDTVAAFVGRFRKPRAEPIPAAAATARRRSATDAS